MATGTTGQLGLALPVQGELSGTWGDTVNNGITQYTNIAIAGTLTLTDDGAVTLANTTGDASASNITSTLTGAGTVTAQFAIVRVTGTLTTAKVVTGPSYSKTYTVVNAATGGIVTFKASGQTGVSVAVGETAFVYFNGTDYVKVVGTATAGAAGGSNTQVQFNSSGVLAGSSNMTFNGTTLTVNDLTDSSLTSGRVLYAGASGNLVDSANFTFNGTTVTMANDASISGLTVGKGAGAVSTNTALGASAMTGSGGENTGIGSSALGSNTTGVQNVAVGRLALQQSTTTQDSVAVGYAALQTSSTGSYNTAVGSLALNANTTANFNNALGYNALTGNTTGASNNAFGAAALGANSTGSNNAAFGHQALNQNTTASNNTAVGYQAGYTNTTGTDLAYFGYLAGYSNTTGGQNTAIGVRALYTNSTGGSNTAVGRQALEANTGDSNTGIGTRALYSNTSGTTNVAVGQQALNSNTTASNNTALGYQAGYTNQTGAFNTFLGHLSGYSTTSEGNCFVGRASGYSVTSGIRNTFVGAYNDSVGGAGQVMTTGSKNTILGAFTGNQGGLDIRTASNHIVLSDGDGNPRIVTFNSGDVSIGNTSDGSLPSTGIWIAPSYDATNSSGIAIGHENGSGSGNTYVGFIYNSTKIGSITQSGTTAVLYNLTSDQRLKENIQDAESSSNLIDSIQVRKFDWKTDQTHQRYGFIAQELLTVYPEAVHQPANTDEMMAVDYSKLVPMLIKEVQSLRQRLSAANL